MSVRRLMTKPSLRAKTLFFVTCFLAIAVAVTVVAMSWNARNSVLEQVEQDVDVLSKVLAQSISISQKLPDQAEDILAEGMQATATAIAHFVAAAERSGRNPEQIKQSLRQIINDSNISEIWVTDPKGKAYLNAPMSGVSFTFSPDPEKQKQASAFWPLLQGGAKVINQPMAQREIDGKLFKYVGVPGVDKPRIVQVGAAGELLRELRESVGVNRLAHALTTSGAVKAIYVVKQDLSLLALHSSADPTLTKLSEPQRVSLSEAIKAGTEQVNVLEDRIAVVQTLVDEKNILLGAFIVELSRGPLDELLKEQLISALSIGLSIFLIGVMFSLSFADRIAKPIGSITRVAGKIQRGDFDVLSKLDPVSQRQDEIGELSRVFQKMATEVKNREQILDGLVTQRTQELANKNTALSEAQSVINKELDLARQLQLAILPEHFPPIKSTQGFARMQPATQMGGDFYDFIALPDGRVAIVMADVSGKGVTAAFFMAVARTSINALVRLNPNPAWCLTQANAELCRQNPLDLFVTIFLGIFDPITGALSFANGGHNPPLVCHGDKPTVPLKVTGDIALGIFPDMSYQAELIVLQPRQTLLCFTDGVTEAFDLKNEAFGDERLATLMSAISEMGPKDRVDAIFSAVTNFAGDAPQSDDITVAALFWEP